jgi:purine-binding chemotaxis protein CheW
MPPSDAKLALNAYFDSLTSTDEHSYSDELALASRLLENANSILIEDAHKDELLTGDPLAENTSLLSDSAKIEIESKEIAPAVETVSREAPLLSEVEVAEAEKVSTIDSNTSSYQTLKQKLPNRFQALFFEVAGLTLAIPLIELGGIVQMQELNKLPGKPQWFMGVLIKQNDKYQCVDTARWIMPEKYTQALAESLNYTYAIQLGKTPWALACSHLATTFELTHDDIKWRESGAKRPWLAGMIKQKMCALIDASQLINLLESKPTKTQVVTE